ncbi:saccharopine dehydrogenase family protein [Desulfoluna spongiiphila]|uniref:saccharopine dehydrogenase family protein n=1 Tax=Desulfoluna spongiiphila TaxID=419481 RepID=UPI001256FF6A|nr:saccharopine dehydrogenase NADP-binding domain-containing protein [Desulfoluna spongiiphila]VVS94557.1 saccharopine dehydrogenase nadp binding domain [Desulfoluna spongiiphila]
MNDVVVGVVGGYGRIGTETAGALAGTPGCRLLIGGRNEDRGRALADSLGNCASARAVDVREPGSLAAFCEGCDLVVNCAGPSRLMGDKVALAALDSGTHYVDVGGYDSMYSLLESRAEEIAEKKLHAIVSSGMFPGLTEVFPQYVAATYFDEVDTLAFYYAGRGDFSYSGAYDLICGLEEGAGNPLTYYDHGLIKKENGPPQKVTLPAPVGEAMAHLSMNNKARAMAEASKIGTARFYSAFLGESLGRFLFQFSQSAGVRSEEERVAAAKALVDASHQDVHSLAPCHMMHLAMGGRWAGKKREVTSTLCFDDAHRMSGVVAAGAVRAILGGTARRNGGFLLSQSVDAVRFMAVCKEAGIEPRTTVMA